MADTVTEVKPLEALATIETKPVNLGASPSPEAKAEIELGRKLREFREKGMSAKERIQEARLNPETRFVQSQIDAMKLQLGAGLAKLEDKHKVTIDDAKLQEKIPEGERTLIKETFNAGEKAIDSVVSYLRYAEIVQKANASKETPLNILQKENSSATIDDWDKLCKQALDSLLATGVLEKMAPSFGKLSDSAKRDFIASTLAADPRLSDAVTKALQSVEDDISKLQPVKSNDKYKEASEAKIANETKKQTSFESAIQRIIDTGLPIDEPLLRREILERIDQRRSPESIDAYLQDYLLNLDPDYGVLAKYGPAEANYQKAIQAAEGSDRPTNPESVKQEKREAVAEAKQIRDVLKRRIDDMGPTLKEEKEKKLEKIRGLTNPNKDSSGMFTSAFMQDLSDASKAKRDFDQAEKTIKAEEEKATKDEELDILRRMRQEGEIVRQVEVILNNALVDTLPSILDAATSIKEKEAEEKKNKEDEAKDKAQESMLKQVEEKIEKNWIEYDKNKRKKEVHKEQIGRDMRIITYEGDEGIKRLMLRDMGRGGWETVDLSTLDDDTKKYLEAAFEKHGDKYRDTLLKDYFLARTEGDNYVFGTLYLKDHEWELLTEHFKDPLNKGLTESRHAQELLHHLEEEGIKPSKNLQWLLYALLTAGTIGVGATIAPAAAAFAAKHGAGGLIQHLGAGIGR